MDVEDNFPHFEFSPGWMLSHGDADHAPSGDDRSGRGYVFFQRDLVKAINVSLVTGRPLLLRGKSGSGKSSVAKLIAREMRWRYYERTITSATQAQDLMWEIDYLRRLHDAQASAFSKEIAFLPVRDYITPGVLWWAFDPESAKRRGMQDGTEVLDDPCDPCGEPGQPAVVLLDEIDKAESDTPNNLLVPLGSHYFRVHDIALDVKLAGRAPLIIITSNDERTLSPAFLRRCVRLTLEFPDRNALKDIARLHIDGLDEARLDELLDALSPGGKLVPLSPADFVDAALAAKEFQARPGSPLWTYLVNLATGKQGDDPV